MPLDTNDVKWAAAEKLREEEFKHAVEQRKKQMKAAKLHFFSKRIVFQWPIRFEHHYQPLNRRRGDKGRTA